MHRAAAIVAKKTIKIENGYTLKMSVVLISKAKKETVNFFEFDRKECKLKIFFSVLKN